jgi:hypothetical protein
LKDGARCGVHRRCCCCCCIRWTQHLRMRSRRSVIASVGNPSIMSAYPLLRKRPAQQ